MSLKSHLRLTSLVAVLGAWTLAGTLLLRNEDEPPVPYSRMVNETVSTDHLEQAETVRFFFGHNSVGMNVLDAVSDVYADRGLVPPRIIDLTQGGEGGDGIEHAWIGVNGDPIGKLADFEDRFRSGLGDRVDVALMKFCYVDVNSDTDVDELFAAYRHTLQSLQRDYPEVIFLFATVPLVAEPSWKSRIKRMLGRDDHMGPADNAARQRFNRLVRDTFPASRIWDIAAIESTEPDGSRTEGTRGGRVYYSLYDGYASDPGHLNEAGSEIAAAHLLDLVGSVPVRRA